MKTVLVQSRTVKKGQKFGRREAIGLPFRVKETRTRNRNYVVCRCEYGRLDIVGVGMLAAGRATSCQCIKRVHPNRMTHGRSDSQEYHAWCGVIARCYNESHRFYDDYGGRGIRVCDRWRCSFADFLHDVGLRPSPQHSIDRFPNNDGDYEPGNVRWATKKEQARNRRSSQFVTVGNKTRTVAEWIEVLGIPRHLLRNRLRQCGIPVEQTLQECINRSQ